MPKEKDGHRSAPESVETVVAARRPPLIGVLRPSSAELPSARMLAASGVPHTGADALPAPTPPAEIRPQRADRPGLGAHVRAQKQDLRVCPGIIHQVVECYSFLDGGASLGMRACDEDVIPPFPRHAPAVVGGVVRIGRFSFTDDPCEEGMSWKWHERPIGRTSRFGITLRQLPLLQTCHQAAIPKTVARCVFPIPGFPTKITASRLSIYSPRNSSPLHFPKRFGLRAHESKVILQ